MAGSRRRIDWDDVRQRVQASQDALDQALVEDPERIQAVYRERAARMASRQAGVDARSVTFRALVFSIRSERYAIELRSLAEVLPFTSCTPVPGAPPHFRGVINLRGEIRLVVDLARILGFPDDGSSPPGFVLILRTGEVRGGYEVGLCVDRVEAVRTFSTNDMALTAASSTGLTERYVKARLPNSIGLLDGEVILSDGALVPQ